MDDETRDEYQAEMRALRAEMRVLQGGGESGDAAVSPDTPPLRQRDIIRYLLEERRARAQGGEHSSVKLGNYASGGTSIEVTIRSGEGSGLETPEAVAAKAREIYDALRLTYDITTPKKEG
jgi:hypothetical protein